MILERNGRSWTTREDQIALKFGPQIAAERLGRSPKAVHTRISYLKGQRKQYLRLRTRTEVPVPIPEAPSIVALAERNIAINGWRDLTAATFGDPLPGRSALDRRIDAAIQQQADGDRDALRFPMAQS